MTAVKNNAGFTLIELLIIVATLMIVATLARLEVTNFGQSKNLDASTNSVKALLKDAQTKAANGFGGKSYWGVRLVAADNSIESYSCAPPTDGSSCGSRGDIIRTLLDKVSISGIFISCSANCSDIVFGPIGKTDNFGTGDPTSTEDPAGTAVRLSYKGFKTYITISAGGRIDATKVLKD